MAQGAGKTGERNEYLESKYLILLLTVFKIIEPNESNSINLVMFLIRNFSL
jgi:hypothetical protein